MKQLALLALMLVAGLFAFLPAFIAWHLGVNVPLCLFGAGTTGALVLYSYLSSLIPE